MLIATHNKMMHADEITAIALLKIFTDEHIKIQRVNHDTTDFSKFDMVIDIGKKFDGVKYFDHHQYKGGKSSAGLIWDYIGLNNQYPKISKLINLIDMNDVGIKKAKEFEYSSLLKCFNTNQPLSKKQDEQFEKAVEYTQVILNSLKSMEEEKLKAKNIVKDSYYFNGNSSILELDTFTPHWGSYINGEVQPNVKAVVWEDEEESNWKVRIPSKRLGSYELNGNPLQQNDLMDFVHSAGHFAIAKDEERMKKYLTQSLLKDRICP